MDVFLLVDDAWVMDANLAGVAVLAMALERQITPEVNGIVDDQGAVNDQGAVDDLGFGHDVGVLVDDRVMREQRVTAR